MSRNRQSIGVRGELEAERYLRALGYRLVARNVRYRVGELDLVMVDGADLVFVEVRTRRSCRAGIKAQDTVTVSKQRRLLLAARCFLADPRYERWPARFDVVGIDAETLDVTAHIRAAFEAG